VRERRERDAVGATVRERHRGSDGERETQWERRRERETVGATVRERHRGGDGERDTERE
jgi:hypothetical protein